MAGSATHIAVLAVDLYLPLCGSLKTKRRILKGIKDRVRARFNVSVAEIGAKDKWQKSHLGFCMIGDDKSYLNSCLDKILSLIATVDTVEILAHQLDFL